ncbi:MAG TPA: DUF2269 family protein [Gaiellaceae bacterium]|nr:DUF2269 family protein [Gaiellaceae bacterium]
MRYEWLLFGHLVGAFLWVAGAVAAALLRVAALRRQRPSEVAVLLRAVRPAVPLLGLGFVLAVGFGLWLADDLERELDSTWLLATYALLAWSLVVGAAAGRQDRETRELAEHLAEEGDAPSRALSRRLRDPVNLALNASLLVATAAIVALMVWQPE